MRNSIVAIIQARMQSNRLPGKVMKDIKGIPVIKHLIDRLSLSRNINKVIVATSTDKSNDPLCDYLDRIGVDYFRGSEDDVLDRFYLAAKQFNANHVVRITADCPLIDPAIVDKVISEYMDRSLDYISTGTTFAEGLDTEVISFGAIKTSHENAKLLSEREHLTQYIHNNKNEFKLLVLENKRDESNFRFTVDNEEDFIVVNEIFNKLYSENNKSFGSDDIINFLKKNPEILSINSHIIRNEGLQKSVANDREI